MQKSAAAALLPKKMNSQARKCIEQNVLMYFLVELLKNSPRRKKTNYKLTASRTIIIVAKATAAAAVMKYTKETVR